MAFCRVMCSSHTKKTQWDSVLQSMSCWLEWNTLVSDQHKQTLPSVITRIQCNLFCAQCVLEKHFLWQSQGNILTPEAKGWRFRKPAGARAGVVSTDNSTRVQETRRFLKVGRPGRWAAHTQDTSPRLREKHAGTDTQTATQTSCISPPTGQPPVACMQKHTQSSHCLRALK